MDREPIEIHAATPGRFEDLCAVFESCSDGRNCWCAYWFLPHRDFKAGWGPANRSRIEALVRHGGEPGLIAYVNDSPAGWVGVGPREWYDRLERSRPLARLSGDRFGEGELWSVNCFIVAKPYRRTGLMRDLLAAAIRHARAKGARAVEGYPVDAPGRKASWDLFTGTPSSFRDAGFVEVARRLERRPIMRLMLDQA